MRRLSVRIEMNDDDAELRDLISRQKTAAKFRERRDRYFSPSLPTAYHLPCTHENGDFVCSCSCSCSYPC